MSHGTDPGVAAWSALLRVNAAVVPAIGQALERRTTLPLSWYDVLLELNADRSGRLRMSELGDRAVLSRTRVSRIVDELVRAGHVERQQDPDDARASFAKLTETGRRAFRRAAPVYLDLIAEHFSRHLDKRSLQALGTALERVLAAQTAVTDRR